MNNFEEKFQQFFMKCQGIIERHNQSMRYPQELTIDEGRRYLRIVRRDISSASAWAFVDKTNGNVLKPASWKAPAKHARGNIFDEHNGIQNIGPYGPAYLR